MFAGHLAWFDRNLQQIRPHAGGEFQLRSAKALAEFAMVHSCLEDWRDRDSAGYAGFEPHLPRWRAFITRLLEEPLYAEAARKNPSHAYLLLLPYLMLRARGYRFSYHEDTLRLLRRWGYPRAQEVIPYRQLDREHFFWKAGLSPSDPDWHELYRATTLAAPGSLAFLDKEGAYSITHTVLYLCDFGNRPAPFAPGEREAAWRVVECLLLHYWRIGNWDLVGELLANLDCLEAPESAIRQGAEAAFREAAIDGAVPADRETAERIASEGATMPDADRFALCYHTTLVSILQCCIEWNRHNAGS